MFPLPEDDPDNPLPFSAGFAVLLVVGAAYLHLVFFLGPVLFQFAPPESLASPARAGIAVILAYGCAFALAAQRVREAPGEALGFVPAPSLGWLAAVLLLPSILLVSEVDNVVKVLLPLPETLQGKDAPLVEGMRIAELAFVTVAVRPVIEEVFFRGLLQPRLVEAWGRSTGVIGAALLAGLAFSVGRLNPWAFHFVVASSLLLGVLRESTGSVLPGLALNVAFGAIALLASFGALGIPGFDDASAAHTPLVWLLPAAATTGLALGLCRVLLRASDLLQRDTSPD